MPSPSITYTFSNSTTADASQVNQNFTDIINGITDGTKDLSISALTVAGNATFSGNTTLGNASSDDVTITGSLASSIPIKTTNTYNIGSSTLGLASIYLGANSQTVRILGSASMSATWTFTLPVTAGTDGYYLKTNGSGVSSWQAFTTPTVQSFTSGSGTYTTPANVKYIQVEMVGGGGGGGGSGTSGADGGAGGNSTFGTALLAANAGSGGVGGLNGVAGGGGGTASLGAAIGIALSGGGGNGTSNLSLAGVGGAGGSGGNNALSGGGGAPVQTAAGIAGVTNSGGGGSGAGGGTTVATSSGAGGGGAGGYLKAIIATPSATYSYAVGAAGAVGTAGTNGQAGGAGGSGIIVVTEYYS